MDKEQLLKLADEKNKLIGSLINDLQDSEKADQDVILPQDVINKRRIDRARLRLIKNLLVGIYSIVDKLDDDANRDIIRLQLLIDESYL